MSLKAIIVLPMRDSCRMPPMGKFFRSQKHDSHIWESREYDLEKEEDLNAFNEAIDPALAFYPGKMPRPKPVIFHDEEECEEKFEDTSEGESVSRIKKRRARVKPGFVPSFT